MTPAPLRVLLLALELVVLTLLHLIFTALRLLALLLQLHRALFRAPTTHTVSADLAAQRWGKVPTHLAVVFVKGASLRHVIRSWGRRFDVEGVDAEEEREKLVRDCRELVGWAKELGVHSLSLYDSDGVLESNAEKVLCSLVGQSGVGINSNALRRGVGRTSFELTMDASSAVAHAAEGDKVVAEIDSGCGLSDSGIFEDGGASTPGSSTLVDLPTGSLRSTTNLTVNLISRKSGRPHLAKVAQDLARAVLQGRVEIKRLAEGLVEETIEATAISEPDALLVLGGPYLRLHGFPPWQIRLTEMHHHSTPSWLPAPAITYDILRKALDVYGGAEMRLGR